VKVGVVGCGHLGSIHARIWAEMPRAEFLGVQDTDAARAEAVVEKHGGRAYGSLEELAAEAEALSVCVPTPAHAEVVSRALAGGCHVLVEKPIASSVEEGERMIREAAAAGKQLMVGHVERFNPAMLAAMGELKKPGFVESIRIAPFVSRGSDVPVVLDLMIHDIDLLCMLLDDEPESLDAAGIPVLTPDVDIANVRLRFKGGCVANLTASRISLKRERKIRFFQPDSYLMVDLMDRRVLRIAKGEGFEGAVARALMDPSSLEGLKMESLIEEGELPLPEGEPLGLELSAFHQALEEGRRPPVTGEDGLRALKVAQWILEQVRSHA